MLYEIFNSQRNGLPLMGTVIGMDDEVPDHAGQHQRGRQDFVSVARKWHFSAQLAEEEKKIQKW